MTTRTAPRRSAAERSPADQAGDHGAQRYSRLKRATIAGATAFITASIWICAPVLAL